jgi:hypothetical protein
MVIAQYLIDNPGSGTYTLTKQAVENVLTGTIETHTHPATSGGKTTAQILNLTL